MFDALKKSEEWWCSDLNHVHGCEEYSAKPAAMKWIDGHPERAVSYQSTLRSSKQSQQLQIASSLVEELGTIHQIIWTAWSLQQCATNKDCAITPHLLDSFPLVESYSAAVGDPHPPLPFICEGAGQQVPRDSSTTPGGTQSSLGSNHRLSPGQQTLLLAVPEFHSKLRAGKLSQGKQHRKDEAPMG